MSGRRLRLAVIGHVEHITLGRVAAIPRAGEIAHLVAPLSLAGGGGGIAFFQIARSPAEPHLFTALGNDDAAGFVQRAFAATRATLHAAHRDVPHTRDIVMIGPDGDRTIVVVGAPLHPSALDPLPWDLLDELDAVYFTAEDPALLVAARRARCLVVPARRRACIAAAGVPIDVIVGSHTDPRESSARADYALPPTAVVMTEGARGGTVETADGTARFTTPAVKALGGGSYGAGDSFAGALTYYLAAGHPPLAAAGLAAPHGAAVLSGLDPLAAQLPILDDDHDPLDLPPVGR